MKLHHYPEPDSLYIELKSTPGAEARPDALPFARFDHSQCCVAALHDAHAP
jgi:hypothetical protein